MERSHIEPAIKSILAEIHQRMIEATRIATAANACAQAGSIDDGIDGAETDFLRSRTTAGCSITA
jgi:hypothetical protein